MQKSKVQNVAVSVPMFYVELNKPEAQFYCEIIMTYDTLSKLHQITKIMLDLKTTSMILIVCSFTSIIATATTEQCCDGANCCEKGWLGYNGYCYRYISYKKSWSDARTYCASLGADLVSIHSTVENDIVTVLTRGAEVGIHQWVS